jgi:phosphoenolpyruvate carboxykinase (GTP)
LKPRSVADWAADVAQMTTPKQIRIISGTDAERQEMIELLLAQGTIKALNHELRPDSYLALTDPRDVARVESRTFVCSEHQDDAGPTNNWEDPSKMRKKLIDLFDGSMAGRTMYIIPFAMGPVGGPHTKYGVEITDSPYVVLSMMIMTRVRAEVLKLIEEGAAWVPALHTVGSPLAENQGDVSWPCDPDNVHVVQFPETYEIWSYGSGYGGNSLLGKKAMSLRIGSVMARNEGWLAEHMMLIRVTAPNGDQFNLGGAFPSACGKTNLAMLQPSLEGYKVETLGDDITWIFPDGNGKLFALNPENGLFGVAPGTGWDSNPIAMESMGSGALFTNVAETPDGDVWWEGMTKTPPANLTDWQGRPWDPNSGEAAAHPNSRFCVPMENCPTTPKDWDSPEGFELHAILFGGRRAANVPLVTQSFDWNHGVFLGATIASEQTAAAEGVVGALRRDPFAMLPFCGYNMADYWNHWLEVGRQVTGTKIFQVNWFRKNDEGKFIWPGFSENSRVIDWIVRSLQGKSNLAASPLGFHPGEGDLNIEGLALQPEQVSELFNVETSNWLEELVAIEEFLSGFGGQLPEEMTAQSSSLRSRLEATRG